MKDFDGEDLDFALEHARFNLDINEITKIRSLLKLASFIEIDLDRGQLIIKNRAGSAKITIRDDGTLRIEGICITTSASESIVLDAAVIGLN